MHEGGQFDGVAGCITVQQTEKLSQLVDAAYCSNIIKRLNRERRELVSESEETRCSGHTWHGQA